MLRSTDSKLKGAFIEANRCLHCWDPPCDKGCPAGVEVSRFIRLLSKGDIMGASEVIEKNNPMGLICGWICPHSTLCQKECTSHKIGSAIDIRMLQRFALGETRDNDITNSFISNPDIMEQNINISGEIHEEKISKDNNLKGKVAIIGAGPSGLVAGLFLSKLGHEVTLFEKNDYAGGRLVYGIPHFRLSREVLIKELEQITKRVSINYGKTFGIDFSINALVKEGFDAIYVATGKWSENTNNIKGYELKGAYTADEVLTGNDWKDYKYKNAAVIGAGNVAMDTARVLVENGVENVYIIYRRTQKEMTAWPEEWEDTWNSGVVFQLLAVPDEIIGDVSGNVCSIRCIRTEPVSEIDSSRRSIRGIEGLDFQIPVDMVVSALGYNGDPKLYSSQGFEVDSKGHIKVNKGLAANIKGVFAGGDVIGSDRGTVVQAVADGKLAAINIHKYILERGKHFG